MFSRTITKITVIALGSFFCTASLYAQNIPDAGSILRDQKLPQQPSSSRLPESETVKEVAPSSSVERRGVDITVKSFVFKGYDGLVTEQELHDVTSAYAGKKLSFGELQGVADKVTAFLKGKGWFLAKAYFPQQDVTSGVIEIDISQGLSDGTLSIKRNSEARISPVILQRIGNTAVSKGKPLNENKMERSLLLMNDLPGVFARASLSPGSDPNSSGVELTVNEEKLVSATLSTDNQGNYYTGPWRATAMMSINDPYGCGDQWSLLLTSASGLLQGRVGYNHPLTRDGLKGNVAYTGMHYDLGAELAGEQYSGYSHSVEAGLDYPLRRSRGSNVATALSFGYKSLVDSKADISIREKQVQSATIGLTGDYSDQLLGGSYTGGNVSCTTGNLHESILDTAQNFTRFNYGISRTQYFAKSFNFGVVWSAQKAVENLDSGEKFSVGGPSGVRAYPVGEGSCDEGNLFNVDLRYNLPLGQKAGALQLGGFFDAARVTLQKNAVTLPGTATNLNEYWLKGAGAGFTYSFAGRFMLRGSWAHVIGDNPGRSAAGHNSDGRDNKSFTWLQAMVSF